jgi:hypothetical protein
VLPAVELAHDPIIAGGRSRLGGWSRGVATTEGNARAEAELAAETALSWSVRGLGHEGEGRLLPREARWARRSPKRWRRRDRPQVG